MTPAARTRRRMTPLVLAAGLVAAACSEQEDAVPGTAAPVVTTTTTTTTTIPATTTTAPPTTTTTSTTTTVTPTTTAAPVPVGDPTEASTPVFAGTSIDAWLHLGRWTGSGWEPAVADDGSPIESDIAPGTEVTIAELGQTPVSGSAGEPDEACFDEATGAILGPVIAPNAGVPDEPGFGYRAIALPANWEVHPREAVEIDETIAAYADAGVAAFADDPVETQAGEVDQTVVVDLDGDGDTEVLVVFGHENERVEGESGLAGGFSALLLLDADSRDGVEVAKSFSSLVDTDDTDPDGEGEDQGPAVTPFDTFRVLDVADLNGDGVAEVVVHSWTTGAASVTVYEYDGATLTEVLSAGCGS